MQTSSREISAAAATLPKPGSFARRLWGAAVLFVLYATTWPFYPEWPPETALARILTGNLLLQKSAVVPDAVQNILLFLPFGFLGYIGLRGKRRIARITRLGVLLSLLIEMLQIFIAPRTPALLDMIANASGSLLGAVMARMMSPAMRIFVMGLKEKQYEITLALGIWTLYVLGLAFSAYRLPEPSAGLAWAPLQNFLAYGVFGLLCSRWYAGQMIRRPFVQGALGAVGFGFLISILQSIPGLPIRLGLSVSWIWTASALGALIAWIRPKRLPSWTLFAICCGIVFVLDRVLLRNLILVYNPDAESVWPMASWMERFLLFFAFGLGSWWARRRFALIQAGIAAVLLAALTQVLLGLYGHFFGWMAVCCAGALCGAWIGEQGEIAFAAYAHRTKQNRIQTAMKKGSRP